MKEPISVGAEAQFRSAKPVLTPLSEVAAGPPVARSPSASPKRPRKGAWVAAPPSAVLLLLTSLLGPALGAEGLAPAEAVLAAGGPDVSISQGGRTTVRFFPELLEDLGLRVEDLSGGALTHEVVLSAHPPSGFVFAAPRGDFESLASGALDHRGGLQLVDASARVVRFPGFVVRAGRVARTLEVFGAAPGAPAGAQIGGRELGMEPLLVADHMHFALDERRLRVFNLDLRATAALAKQLGRPALAGQPLGSLEVETAVAGSGLAPTSTDATADQSCAPEVWPGEPRSGGGVFEADVHLSEMSSVAMMMRRRDDLSHCVSGDTASCLVVIAPSAQLRNVGSADVPWYGKRSGNFPPYGNDQHPYLVWHLYRAAQGRFEMIGASALKHAFLSLNSGCRCFQANILYASNGEPNHPPVPTPELTEICDDVYGTTTNNFSSALGPRSEVTAHTGVWNDTGFAFPSGFSSASDRRLAVPESELAWPGAVYYFEAWYVVREDIDIFNSMGFWRIGTNFDGTFWTFPYQAEPGEGQPTYKNGPAIDAWVPPASPPPGAQSVRIDTGQGHLTLAVRTYDLGGGQVRYEYALMNHDEDRRIRSFLVPVGNDVIQDPTFHDVDRNASTDWPATVGSGQVGWSATDPSTHSLDWGTMSSFGFLADAVPAPVRVRLGFDEGGGEIEVEILGPQGGIGLLGLDDFESGTTQAWDEASP